MPTVLEGNHVIFIHGGHRGFNRLARFKEPLETFSPTGDAALATAAAWDVVGMVLLPGLIEFVSVYHNVFVLARLMA
jgi:hypothetical protein